jgi:hypothetical protein
LVFNDDSAGFISRLVDEGKFGEELIAGQDDRDTFVAPRRSR